MRTNRHLVSTALCAAVAIAAAACAGDRSTSPQVASPTAAIVPPGMAPCDPILTQAVTDAHAFFASPSDPVFGLLQQMQAGFRANGPRGATNPGFDILDQIAQARLTSRQGGTAANGDALTKDVLACMSVGAIPVGFSVQAALTNGIFEVRGGTTNTATPALAQLLVNGGRTFASPLWGVESLNTWDGQFEKVQTRFLVYGAPLPVSTFSHDPASTDPNNVAFTGFDISTIPATPRLLFIHPDGSAAPIRVGICIDPAVGGNPNLLVHAAATDTTILALSNPTFCAAFARDVAPSGLLARFAHAAASLVMPTPAFALVGGVGGLPSGLSPFGPVKVSVDDIILTFIQGPSNGQVGSAITPPIKVLATTENGTPIGGVRILLRVQNSDGSEITGATGNGETTSDLPTGPGIATFAHLTIPQGGTFTIRAGGSMNGQTTLTVTSQPFTVQ